MEKIIEKYEAKLQFLDNSLEQVKNLLDEDTMSILQDLRVILTEIITDLKAIDALSINK